MTIGFSLGRSTCLSDSTIADDDTLDCLHLVLIFSAIASAAWDGEQAEWRAEVCSDGGQGWSNSSAPAKERVEWPALIVNVSEVVVVAHSSHDGPQMAARAINGPFTCPTASSQPSRGGTTSAHYFVHLLHLLQATALFKVNPHNIALQSSRTRLFFSTTAS